MTSLVACIGTGKGTWALVQKLLVQEQWDKVFLITNNFGMEKFSTPKDAERVLLDDNWNTMQCVEHITKSLQGKIAGFEVGVNLTSGTGREHMAIISSVLKLGLAVRLVEAGAEKVSEL
jgi:hypothetical protein